MSRRTRRLALVTLVAFALLLAGGFLATRGGVPRVSAARAARAKGLPLAAVQRLFGSPGVPVASERLPARPGDSRLLIDIDTDGGGYYGCPTAVCEDPAVEFRLWPGHDLYHVLVFRGGVCVNEIGAGPMREGRAGWATRQLARLER